MINLYKIRISSISIPQLLKKKKFTDKYIPDGYENFYTSDNLDFITADNLTFIVIE